MHTAETKQEFCFLLGLFLKSGLLTLHQNNSTTDAVSASTNTISCAVRCCHKIKRYMDKKGNDKMEIPVLKTHQYQLYSF